jgi:hypothetical protein
MVTEKEGLWQGLAVHIHIFTFILTDLQNLSLALDGLTRSIDEKPVV